MPFISTSCLVTAPTLRTCQRAESSSVSSTWFLWWEAYPGQPRADVSTVQDCEDGRQTSHPTAGPFLGLASSREPLNNHLLRPPPAGGSSPCPPNSRILSHGGLSLTSQSISFLPDRNQSCGPLALGYFSSFNVVNSTRITSTLKLEVKKKIHFE